MRYHNSFADNFAKFQVFYTTKTPPRKSIKPRKRGKLPCVMSSVLDNLFTNLPGHCPNSSPRIFLFTSRQRYKILRASLKLFRANKCRSHFVTLCVKNIWQHNWFFFWRCYEGFLSRLLRRKLARVPWKRKVLSTVDILAILYVKASDLTRKLVFICNMGLILQIPIVTHYEIRKGSISHFYQCLFRQFKYQRHRMIINEMEKLLLIRFRFMNLI